MVLTYRNEKHRLTKVLVPVGKHSDGSTRCEGCWAKVIAINEEKNEAIAILLNNVLGGYDFGWGDIIYIRETNPEEWFKVSCKVMTIPKGFTVLLERHGDN